MLTKLANFQKLQDHFQTVKDKTLREFFNEDPERAAKFSLEFESLFLDYSKNRITSETLELLLKLAEEAGLKITLDNALANILSEFSQGRDAHQYDRRLVLSAQSLRDKDKSQLLKRFFKVRTTP